MVTDEEVEKLMKAGGIAKRTVKLAESIVKPGVKLIEVASMLEKYIVEQGGQPAFPVNISVNNIAAHYTPIPNDESIIPDNSVVKIDIGVHVDGYIADTAITLCFNPVYEGLVEATRKALEKAIEVVKPGIRASEIGRVIEDTIRSHGYKPIKNLSGHGLERFIIHSGVIIPNYHDRLNLFKLGEGVYAIEPFASNGDGIVDEGPITAIYALKPSTKRIPDAARQVYEAIYNERKTLPFAARWYVKPGSETTFYKALDELKRSRLLVEYPILVERKNAIVSQFEHTIVITKREVIVTTI